MSSRAAFGRRPVLAGLTAARERCVPAVSLDPLVDVGVAGVQRIKIAGLAPVVPQVQVADLGPCGCGFEFSEPLGVRPPAQWPAGVMMSRVLV